MIMEKAKVSEIFLSYQGEGPFAGSRQLFVRFYGCNRTCVYCDTPLESYKAFTAPVLLDKVLAFGEDYNELVLTGGEPLLYADFLSGFLSSYRAERGNSVYLETNGTLPEELAKIIDKVDIIAMDVKLPSSTNDAPDVWDEHKKFAKIASTRELFIKAVVTNSTTMDDIVSMEQLVSRLGKDVEIVLQPVTPVGDAVKRSDEEMLMYFEKYLEKKLGKNIKVLGQMHKCMGIK